MDSPSIWEALYSREYQAGFFAGEGLAFEPWEHDSHFYQDESMRSWEGQDTSDVVSNHEITYSPARSEDLKSRWSLDDSDIIGITEVEPFMYYRPGSCRDICNQSSSSSPKMPLSVIQSSLSYPSPLPSMDIDGSQNSSSLQTTLPPQNTSSRNPMKFNYTETTYQYVEGNGGCPLIHVNGYKFYKSNERKTVTIWTCAGKTKYKCKKRLRQTASAVLVSDGDHTHPGDHMLTQVDSFVEAVRKRVRTELNSSIKDIYDSQAKLYQTNGPETKATLEAAPPLEFIMSAMKRARRKVLPVIPKTREDVNFDLCGLEHHILIEDGDTEKIVVVSTPDLFKHLCKSEQLHMDGTFKSAPDLYAQLFIIHGTAHDMLWPLLFCLLPGKTQGLYTRLFRLLSDYAKKQGLLLSPRCIHIDFEKAISNSLQAIFPGSTVKGCFFHFSQCVFNRIKKVGLQVEYNIFSFACRAILRRLFYIPFLPVEEMVNAFEQIADESKWSGMEGSLLPEHIPKLRKVMSYFRKNWIWGMRLERFNVWSVTVRTNNKAEAFNNSLNKKVKPHPNVYALVRFLGEDQNVNTEIGIMQAAKGSRACKQRHTYRIRDELIEEAKEWLRHEVYTPLEYVDRISLVYDEKQRERMMRNSQEEQDRHGEGVIQIPVATPMPAAVRRKSHLKQYCRLSVPRPRMIIQTQTQSLQQNTEGQPVKGPSNEGMDGCHEAARETHSLADQMAVNEQSLKKCKFVNKTAITSEEKQEAKSNNPKKQAATHKKHMTKPKIPQEITCKGSATEPVVDEPRQKKSKIVNASASNHQLKVKRRRCTSNQFGRVRLSNNMTKRRRTPFLTPYAMPDTLVPATPLWLETKKHQAKKLSESSVLRERPIAVVANSSGKNPAAPSARRTQKKLSLEEAIHMVLSDDE